MAIAALQGGRESGQGTPGRGFASRKWRNDLQTRVEIPLLVRLLGVPAGCDMLETGCGGGNSLLALADACRPGSLTGVDIDDDLLRLARARCASHLDVELVQADVRELPFADSSFDLVIDFGTLYHVRPVQHALSEVARVLRVNGLFVHETRLGQVLAHPLRSSYRRLPWRFVPQLASGRSAVLWAYRIKQTGHAYRDSA